MQASDSGDGVPGNLPKLIKARQRMAVMLRERSKVKDKHPDNKTRRVAEYKRLTDLCLMDIVEIMKDS